MRPFLLAIVSAVALVAQPSITKVEPPNWFLNHSINPVRLLIRGAGLQNAHLDAAGLGVSRVSVNAPGTYLFADVTIPSGATAGAHDLRVTTRAGSAQARFDVIAPLPRDGRFQGFSPEDVIYLVMPDRFANGDTDNDDPKISAGLYDRTKPRYYHGGDLQGVIGHLPYLKQLGITALWMTPLYDNVNHLNDREKYDDLPITDYHGYGAIDYYGVEEHLGTLDLVRQLVDRAHALGIKVIQDQVANHTGPFHPWVTDAPLPNWYHGTEASHVKETWQTFTLEDPHATTELKRSTLDGWFIDILPDMNQEEPEVARYEIQNTLWWLGMTGFDAIRQDTLPYVPRTFWRQWMQAIRSEYPHVKVVGEMFDEDPALVSFFQGGTKRFDGVDSLVDTVFDFPAYFKIRDTFARGGNLKDLANVVGHDYLYPNPNLLVTFLGLHDVKRFMNESRATADGLKLAFTFLMTARGVPLIYYGDEIGMSGGDDPDNRRDFPGGWKEDPRNAFDAQGRTPSERDLFDYVQKLIQLRAQLEPLRLGKMSSLAVTDQAWVYSRETATQKVIVAINNGVTPYPVPITNGTTLPPRSAEIYVIDKQGAHGQILRK